MRGSSASSFQSRFCTYDVNRCSSAAPESRSTWPLCQVTAPSVARIPSRPRGIAGCRAGQHPLPSPHDRRPAAISPRRLALSLKTPAGSSGGGRLVDHRILAPAAHHDRADLPLHPLQDSVLHRGPPSRKSQISHGGSAPNHRSGGRCGSGAGRLPADPSRVAARVPDGTAVIRRAASRGAAQCGAARRGQADLLCHSGTT